MLNPLILSAALLGCSDKSANDTGTAGDSGDGGTSDGVTIVISDVVGTVIDASWPASAGASAARIEAQLTSGEGDLLVAQATTSGETSSVQLLGLIEDRDYTLRVIETIDGAEVELSSTDIRSGAAPGTLPSVSVETDGSGRHSGRYMLTTILNDPSTIVIYDDEGNLVWWYQTPEENHIVTRAHLRPDGSGVAFISKNNAAVGDAGDPTYIFTVDWNGDDFTTVELVDGHHDFVEHADGTFAYLSSEAQEHDGEYYLGDRLLEQDTGGNVEEIWNVWDYYEPEPDLGEVEGTSWSHGNSVDWREDEGKYLIGSRNFNAIWQIDPTTGGIDWQLGGKYSDFVMGSGAEFNWQHQFELVSPTRMLIFDNGNLDRYYSRALELELDLDTMTAEVVWEHVADPPLFCYGPGDVERLDSGNTLVTWGSSGVAEEVTAEGEVVWTFNGGLGGAIGYVTTIEDLNAL